MAFAIEVYDSEAQRLVLTDDEHPEMRVVVTGPDALALGRALRDALPIVSLAQQLSGEVRSGKLADVVTAIKNLDAALVDFGEG